MRCGKNRTLFDFLPARQITRAGSACMEMIHGFKEGWIIWHPRGLGWAWLGAPQEDNCCVHLIFLLALGPICLNKFDKLTLLRDCQSLVIDLKGPN